MTYLQTEKRNYQTLNILQKETGNEIEIEDEDEDELEDEVEELSVIC